MPFTVGFWDQNLQRLGLRSTGYNHPGLLTIQQDPSKAATSLRLQSSSRKSLLEGYPLRFLFWGSSGPFLHLQVFGFGSSSFAGILGTRHTQNLKMLLFARSLSKAVVEACGDLRFKLMKSSCRCSCWVFGLVAGPGAHAHNSRYISKQRKHQRFLV